MARHSNLCQLGNQAGTGRASADRRRSQESDDYTGRKYSGQAAALRCRTLWGVSMDEPLRRRVSAPSRGVDHDACGHPDCSGMEVSLVNAMSRETILRQYLDTLKGNIPISHRLPALPWDATVNHGRCKQDRHSRSRRSSARQRVGTAAFHGKQGKAADRPKLPDRRYPADDGGQPKTALQEISALLRGDLRQQDRSIRHKFLCPGKGNQRRGKSILPMIPAARWLGATKI